MSSPKRYGEHPGSPSSLRPLRFPVFRALWTANLFSFLGTWVQSVGAAWAMAELAQAADYVALIQTAAMLRVMLLSLLGGILADLWNRRRVILLAQIWMASTAVLLALLDYFGQLTPGLLLGLTAAIGIGTAVSTPAWQASIGELVPEEDLPPSIALNSMGINIARAVGPAQGGLIVAGAGAKAAFLFNALSALRRWDCRPARATEVRETMRAALAPFFRHLRTLPPLQAPLTRAA